MIKIRKSTFETNSSSSHCLVYSQANPNRIEYKLETDNGVLTIHFKSYGWCGPNDQDILASSNDKLDYIMTRLCRHLGWECDKNGWCIDDVSYSKAEEMIETGAIYEIDEARELLVRIQDLCPEIKEVEFELNYFGDVFGEIDHQSQDLLDNEDLINIIFNKSCLILITNDNSDYYEIFNEDLKPGLNKTSSRWTGEEYNCYNITEEDFEK